MNPENFQYKLSLCCSIAAAQIKFYLLLGTALPSCLPVCMSTVDEAELIDDVVRRGERFTATSYSCTKRFIDDHTADNDPPPEVLYAISYK